MEKENYGKTPSLVSAQGTQTKMGSPVLPINVQTDLEYLVVKEGKGAARGFLGED